MTKTQCGMLKELFDKVNYGIAIYEPIKNGQNFIFKYYNKTGAHWDKLKVSNVIGREVTKIFPNIKEFGLFKILQLVHKTGKAQHLPVSVYKDNKVTFWRNNYVFKLKTGEIVAVYYDATAEKKLEDLVYDEKIKFEQLFNNASDAIFIHDLQGKFLEVNKTACKRLGYPKKELLKLKPQNVTDPLDAKKVASKIQEIIKKGNSIFESTLITKNKHKILVEINSKLIIFEGKKAILSMARDISARKEADIKQKKLEDLVHDEKIKFEQLFNNASDAIFIHDLKGNFLEVNKTACQRLGYTKKELLKLKPQKIDDPVAAKKVAPKIKEIVKKGSNVFETVHLTKNGQKIPVEINSKLIIFEGKKAILSMARDITARKEADIKQKKLELNLEKEKNRFKNMVEILADWIWEVDLTGKYTYVSKNVINVLGYSAKEMLGKKFYNYLDSNDVKEVKKFFTNIVKKGLPIVNLENLNFTKSGDKVWLLTNAVPIYNQTKKIIGYRGVDKNITLRKKQEIELAEKVEELEKINDLMTGRELKMIELKNKIKELEKQIQKT